MWFANCFCLYPLVFRYKACTGFWIRVLWASVGLWQRGECFGCLNLSYLSCFFWGSVLLIPTGVLGCANLKSDIRPMQFRDEPKNSELHIFCAKYRKKHRDKGFLLVFWCLWGWNLGYFVPDFGVTCLGEILQMVDNKSFSVKAFQSYSCYS